MSAEQAYRIINWDTTGLLTNLEGNFQSIVEHNQLEIIEINSEVANPIEDQASVKSSDSSDYRISHLFCEGICTSRLNSQFSTPRLEIDTNLEVEVQNQLENQPNRSEAQISSPTLQLIENQLGIANVPTYGLDVNNDVTSNLGIGDYAIDRAENLAFAIAYGTLESLVNSPPTSWQSVEDNQSRTESVLFRSSVGPLELRSALAVSVSNGQSSSEIGSESYSGSENSSSDTSQSIGETVITLASVANTEDINLNQLPRTISIVTPVISTQIINPQIINPVSNLPNPGINPNIMAIYVLPVVMRPGLPTDRPYSTVPYPLFYGQVGSDSDRHIKEFLTACNSNNARTEHHWLEIFPSTFMGMARDWFNR